MSKAMSHKQIERWLACILMSGLMINLHVLPAHQIAFADDPVQPACPLPVPIPPEMQQLIETQQAVYAAVFAGSFDPCGDSGLLLDDPLDGSSLPAFATGQNSADEAFEFEVLAWFEADYSGLSSEDQALITDWGTVAGLAIGELSTQLGAIRVAALAVSAEPPDHSAPRMNVLLPVDLFPDEAWEALQEYYTHRAYWNPCGQDLDQEAQNCLQSCRNQFVSALNNCKSTAEGCLGVCGWIGVLAVLTCIMGAVTGGSTFWPCVGFSGAASACVLNCLNTFAGCVSSAKDTFDNCVNDCFVLLAQRAGAEPAP